MKAEIELYNIPDYSGRAQTPARVDFELFCPAAHDMAAHTRAGNTAPFGPYFSGFGMYIASFGPVVCIRPFSVLLGVRTAIRRKSATDGTVCKTNQ